MLTQWLGQTAFSVIHRKNIVYNTCWEDPRLDREAMKLSAHDTVLVITSAGCNALDYALQSPRKVFAVDVNPLQNALLELKLAGIRSLSHADFFQAFGQGFHSQWHDLYYSVVRPELSPQYRSIWDKRTNLFGGTGRRRSFYFRGTSGWFAWLINGYLNRSEGLRDAVEAILQAETVLQQREIYHSRGVQAMLWRQPLQWALGRDTTLSLLGVPRSQRMQIERCYPGGIRQFIQDRIEAVFTEIPLHDNYFWRVYLTGSYTPECCPEYLKPGSFESLKSGLVDRISTHTNTVQGFLSESNEKISRFVLLDHMDWLYEHFPEHLAAEWQSIVHSAAARSRVLWRSAALEVDFVDRLSITADGKPRRVGELLNYHSEMAAQLHARDRVHTYGSFYLAELVDVAA